MTLEYNQQEKILHESRKTNPCNLSPSFCSIGAEILLVHSAKLRTCIDLYLLLLWLGVLPISRIRVLFLAAIQAFLHSFYGKFKFA